MERAGEDVIMTHIVVLEAFNTDIKSLSSSIKQGEKTVDKS